MRHAILGWLVLALAGIGSTSALAQRNRAHRTPSRGAIEAPQFGLPRPPNTVASPRGDGIIHWNTPNKDGNLGGPGAGGSSGS